MRSGWSWPSRIALQQHCRLASQGVTKRGHVYWWDANPMQSKGDLSFSGLIWINSMWWKLTLSHETGRSFRSYQPAVRVNDIVLHNSPCRWPKRRNYRGELEVLGCSGGGSEHPKTEGFTSNLRCLCCSCYPICEYQAHFHNLKAT